MHVVPHIHANKTLRHIKENIFEKKILPIIPALGRQSRKLVDSRRHGTSSETLPHIKGGTVDDIRMTSLDLSSNTFIRLSLDGVAFSSQEGHSRMDSRIVMAL